MAEMQVQGWLRSEILDAATCDICAALDGIILPADDPRWSGEYGQLAHIGCRVCFVPLYDMGVLDFTPDDALPDVITRRGFLQLTELWDEYPHPAEALKRMTDSGITIEEELELLEPYELMGFYLGLGT